MIDQIPPPSSTFSHRIEGAFGQAGASWLLALPELLRSICSSWDLRVESFQQNPSYNVVVHVLLPDDERGVLKLGVPNHELFAEIDALRAYAGCGAARLLRTDPERGVLLMERLDPGSPLVLEDDEHAMQVAARVMMQLWRADPTGVNHPSVKTWGEGFQRVWTVVPGAENLLPRKVLSQAEGIYKELCSSSTENVLLHGDLHHWNILSSRRQDWLAIDPKGVLGEAAYEVGAMMRNPFPDLLDWPDLARVQSRRLDRMQELLGFDRKRLWGWAFSQAVLAACWEIEEGGMQWEAWLESANSIWRAA